MNIQKMAQLALSRANRDYARRLAAQWRNELAEDISTRRDEYGRMLRDYADTLPEALRPYLMTFWDSLLGFFDAATDAERETAEQVGYTAMKHIEPYRDGARGWGEILFCQYKGNYTEAELLVILESAQ